MTEHIADQKRTANTISYTETMKDTILRQMYSRTDSSN